MPLGVVEEGRDFVRLRVVIAGAGFAYLGRGVLKQWVTIRGKGARLAV